MNQNVLLAEALSEIDASPDVRAIAENVYMALSYEDFQLAAIHLIFLDMAGKSVEIRECPMPQMAVPA